MAYGRLVNLQTPELQRLRWGKGSLLLSTVQYDIIAATCRTPMIDPAGTLDTKERTPWPIASLLA